MMEQNEPHGIFEPKKPEAVALPMSGTQKAVRLMIVTGVLLIAGLLILVLRDPFMRPVKRYYHGLQKNKIAVMCDAFPDWLQDAQQGQDNMTIADMCSSVDTTKKYMYGINAKISVSLVAKAPLEEEYLRTLESGIESRYSKKVSITKGWDCRLTVTYYPDQTNDQLSMTEYVRVYKMDGRWVILDVPNEKQ